MIGRATITLYGKQQVLEIDNTQQLITDIPEPLRGVFEIWYKEYRRNYSPAGGSFGYGWLNEMAKKFSGKAEFEAKKPHPPGTIY